MAALIPLFAVRVLGGAVIGVEGLSEASTIAELRVALEAHGVPVHCIISIGATPRSRRRLVCVVFALYHIFGSGRLLCRGRPGGDAGRGGARRRERV
jgi:hypothetical protein